MSLSPIGTRRLVDALRGVEMPNWPSLTTRKTNNLETYMSNPRYLNGVVVYRGGSAAARRSPARMQEAVNWRVARAEARKIIERMVQA